MHMSTLDSQRSIWVNIWAVVSKVLWTWCGVLDKAFFFFMFFHTLDHHPYTPVNTFKNKKIFKKKKKGTWEPYRIWRFIKHSYMWHHKNKVPALKLLATALKFVCFETQPVFSLPDTRVRYSRSNSCTACQYNAFKHVIHVVKTGYKRYAIWISAS